MVFRKMDKKRWPRGEVDFGGINGAGCWRAEADNFQALRNLRYLHQVGGLVKVSTKLQYSQHQQTVVTATNNIAVISMRAIASKALVYSCQLDHCAIVEEQ